MQHTEQIKLFQPVIYKGMECVVTNAYVCGGKKVTISPIGNGNSPAKYYTVKISEIKIKKFRTHER